MKTLVAKVSEHNLFLLSSSISYYSALAIAPFLMILLGVAAFLGQDVQHQITLQANALSPEVGKMFAMIFDNVNEGVNVGSVSGIVGVIVLLSTSSLVFLQMRYSFDVIYGYYNPHLSRPIWEAVKEKLFAMLVVVLAGLFFIFSVSLTAIVEYFFGPGTDENVLYRVLVFAMNFIIYVGMFTGIHYYAPTRRPPLIEALKIAILTSTFFIIGNLLLASYLKGVAADSIYGAAGTLLVFLTWSYYSAFIIFLSVEAFIYLRKKGIETLRRRNLKA
ncbi:MAG TPA: YihY/virulence factor BrkB family protein [Bacteriovoracaceae bacterium]|nr:YihY/virulence factor BrkB family protein [Bacteriovoracaceae bacterium]